MPGPRPQTGGMSTRNTLCWERGGDKPGNGLARKSSFGNRTRTYQKKKDARKNVKEPGGPKREGGRGGITVLRRRGNLGLTGAQARARL